MIFTRDIEVSVTRSVYPPLGKEEVDITLTVYDLKKIKLEEVLEILESEIPKERFELLIIAKRLMSSLEPTDLYTIRQLIVGV